MYKNLKGYFTKNTVSNLITICSAVVLYLSLSNFTIVKDMFMNLYGIISPFVIAFVIAFLLNTPVKWFEGRVFYKIKFKRGLSILCSYVIAFIFLGALIVAIMPQFLESVKTVAASIPKWLESFTTTIEGITQQYNIDENLANSVTTSMDDMLRSASSFLLNIVPQLLNLSVSLGTLIINTVMSIIASIYMLISKERLIYQLKKLVYAIFKEERACRVIEIGARANRIFSKFINGKMLDSLIIGIICFVGMLFIYSPYSVLISVIIGVTNMIPFFGPFIGAIPSIFIMLMVSPIDALIFAIFVLFLQQFDGNVLGPKILGDSTGLSPIWVLVSIAIGGGLFSFPGMLIGVPTFAVIYSVLSENISRKLENKKVCVNDKEMTILSNKDNENESYI